MQQPESDKLNHSSSNYQRMRAEEAMVKAEMARNPHCRATMIAVAEQHNRMAEMEDRAKEQQAAYWLQESREKEEIFELAAHAIERRYEIDYQNDLHHIICAHYSPRVKKAVVEFAGKRYGKSPHEVRADLIEKASLVHLSPHTR